MKISDAGRNRLKEPPTTTPPHTHTRMHGECTPGTVSGQVGAGEGGSGSPPDSGCGLLQSAKAFGFQVPPVCPRPTWGPTRYLRASHSPLPPAPNLGNRRDNRSRVRPRHQAEAAVWDKEVRRRGEDFACRRGRGELPRLPPPYFVREGASSTRGAAWSVWERRVGANLPRWRRPAPGRCCCCCCCCS